MHDRARLAASLTEWENVMFRALMNLEVGAFIREFDLDLASTGAQCDADTLDELIRLCVASKALVRLAPTTSNSELCDHGRCRVLRLRVEPVAVKRSTVDAIDSFSSGGGDTMMRLVPREIMRLYVERGKESGRVTGWTRLRANVSRDDDNNRSRHCRRRDVASVNRCDGRIIARHCVLTAYGKLSVVEPRLFPAKITRV